MKSAGTIRTSAACAPAAEIIAAASAGHGNFIIHPSGP
jgi:hypothetical protein